MGWPICVIRALLAIAVVYLVVSRYLLQRAAADPAADGEIDGLAITLYTPRQIDQIAYDSGMLECDCVRQLRHHFGPFLAHFSALPHPHTLPCATLYLVPMLIGC